MRRTKLLLFAVGVSALLATSIAAASGGKRAQTSDVAATFTATASRTATRTCTGEGTTTFTITNAVWRGTATSTEPRLAGNLVLRTHAVVNNATGDGWLNGTWHSRNAPNGRTHAHLSAVIDGASIEGLATGRVHRPSGHLRGNFSAAIAANTISGSLGTGTSDNSALIFRTGCKRNR